MEKENKVEKLVEFLRVSGVFEKFILNVLEQNPSLSFSRIAIDENPIGCAFVWSNTKEGINFWQELKERYQRMRNFPFQNVKFYVGGKSKEVQEKLFSLGYRWTTGDSQVLYTGMAFLYLNDRGEISWGDELSLFKKNSYKEIYIEDILNYQE